MLQQGFDVSTIKLLDGFVKVSEKSKAVDMSEEDVRELGLFSAVGEGEEVLEHARGRARGRDELGELVEFLVRVEGLRQAVGLGCVDAQDTVAEGGRTHELDIFRAAFELCNLLVDLIFGDITFRELLEVFFVEHNNRF